MLTFANLTGGLNTYDLEYMLPENESPDMVNLRWKDGSLGCRAGQKWLNSTSRGIGHSAYEGTFYGYGFFHAGTNLYYFDPATGDVTDLCNLTSFTHGGNGKTRGTWFRYGDDLFYKTRGVFVRIHYDNPGFTATDVSASAYVPVTVVNAAAANGSGDLYQPENRLSSGKTIWYNAATAPKTETFTTTTAKTYTLTDTNAVRVTMLTLNGALLVEGVDWTFNRSNRRIRLMQAPTAGDTLEATFDAMDAHYYLPVANSALRITSITACMTSSLVETSLNGLMVNASIQQWNPAWDEYDYVYRPGYGHILFKTPPYVPFPMVNNTVKVTYALSNNDAFKSIMDCPYATVFGGNQELCIVLGGCDAQPNAYFWNGNNVAMDPTYWPISQYNLAGDTGEPVTGFGKQQSMLVIFNEHSVGRATLSTQDLGGRVTLTMDYVRINSKIGCDVPWTIQLIENNLVFCNKDQGIHFLRDSSAAYENNIIGISKKVNGTPTKAGILSKLRAVTDPETVTSFDDEERYWLVIDGEVYVWDYLISEASKPSFFYYTSIHGRGFIRDGAGRMFHIDHKGRITELVTDLCDDYGQGIQKRYTFPTQFFGTYDRLKDVTRVIFSVRPTTSSRIAVTYVTDWEERRDLTDVDTTAWRLFPRQLERRDLRSTKFASVAIRRPGCRHIRHFQMRLENDEPQCDIGVTFAQIFYKYQGRDR